MIDILIYLFVDSLSCHEKATVSLILDESALA